VRASAFVVGSGSTAGAGLIALARSLGFSRVDPYSGIEIMLERAQSTPLIFLLCAAVPDVSKLKPIAKLLRSSPDFRLRFAPLIYFPPEPSIDTIKACIGMGFDDVIAMPYSGNDLGQRIGRQLGGTHVYYETASYFGPDRRNRVGEERSTDSDHGGGEYRRIEIRRSDTGIDVLSDEFEVVI
jgi:PleD family two-component response regulator